jgi:hypothetical protein
MCHHQKIYHPNLKTIATKCERSFFIPGAENGKLDLFLIWLNKSFKIFKV